MKIEMDRMLADDIGAFLLGHMAICGRLQRSSVTPEEAEMWRVRQSSTISLALKYARAVIAAEKETQEEGTPL